MEVSPGTEHVPHNSPERKIYYSVLRGTRSPELDAQYLEGLNDIDDPDLRACEVVLRVLESCQIIIPRFSLAKIFERSKRLAEIARASLENPDQGRDTRERIRTSMYVVSVSEIAKYDLAFAEAFYQQLNDEQRARMREVVDSYLESESHMRASSMQVSRRRAPYASLVTLDTWDKSRRIDPKTINHARSLLDILIVLEKEELLEPGQKSKYEAIQSAVNPWVDQ